MLSLTIRQALLHGGGGAVFCPEYQDIYDEFIVKPSDADAAAQNLFVKTLVDGLVWSELDRLIILAAHAAGVDSVLDWIHPTVVANRASLVNSPALVLKQGYTSNGVNSYVDLNYNATDDGVKFTLNDATMGNYNRTIEISTFKVDFGVITFPKRTAMYSQRGTEMRAYMNNDTISLYNLGAAGVGHFGAETDATNDFLIKNGVIVSNPVNAPDQFSDEDWFMCAGNNGGAPFGFSTRQQSLFYAGAKLGAAKNLILYNAYQALMTHYGTQV